MNQFCIHHMNTPLIEGQCSKCNSIANTNASNTSQTVLSIVLTDTPRVVELKREFRELDGREQDLKLLRCGEIETPEMVQVRLRKAEIAREIFEMENYGK